MADRTKAESSTQENDRPNPNKKLVRVFDTEQESEAIIVNGLLQSAGIQSDLTSLDAPQDILPGVGGSVILVRAEDAERARQLIAESRRDAEDETAEVDISGDPTGQE
ncbi:MAG: putative signal transducing protein [Terriglobales bacterium]